MDFLVEVFSAHISPTVKDSHAGGPLRPPRLRRVRDRGAVSCVFSAFSLSDERGIACTAFLRYQGQLKIKTMKQNSGSIPELDGDALAINSANS